MGGRDEPEEGFYVEELEELELDATPAPAPTVDERRRLAAELAARAKAPSRLADRAPTPKSAKDVLAAALRAEEEAKEQEIREKRRIAAEARARVEAARKQQEDDAREARDAARQAEEDRKALDAAADAALGRRGVRPRRDLVPVGSARPARPELTDPMGRMVVESRIAEWLGAVAPGVEVVELFVEVPPQVIGPLWQAHHVRAQHEGDLTTLLQVHAVRELVGGRPTDAVAARVSLRGREFAAWFDLDEARVVAMLAPADVFLVGLG